MKITTPKSTSFFSAITKSLRFEANDDQQSDNQTPDSGGDDLDSQLEDLKDEKESQEGDNNDSSDNSDSDSSGDLDNPEDDTGGLGDDGGSDDGFGSSDSGGGSDSSMSSSSDDGGDQGVKKSVGSAPRRLTLYAEFNRIHNVLKESIDAIEKKSTDNSSMKNCVAQLQEILTDVKFVLSNFEYRSEPDVMIHLQLVKRRTSLALQLMDRLNKESTNDRSYSK